MSESTYTPAQMRELVSAQAKVPGEREVEAAGFKVEREYRPDGSYSWRAPFDPKREGEKYLELTRAGREAQWARMSKIQAAKQREALVDADGRTNYVDAHRAEADAARNGWKPKIRVGGHLMKRYAVRGGVVVQVAGPRDGG